ncbi:MAG: TerC family protein [Elusimicrobia bacterium]|nr:TerC family protein [Elusimicrobiota bacterium]
MTPHVLLWLIFFVALFGMLYVDLFQSKSEKAITLREAGLRSLEWVLAALLYCGAIYWFLTPAKAAEFLTGYLIEKSLSVDNLFVFIMIFSYFNVEPAHQPRVLKWGILGAIVMRFVLILLGTYLVSRFQWVFFLFGLILLYSAYKMAFDVEKDFNPNENILFRGLRRVLPMTGLYGNRFLAKIDGKWHATPLFLTVAVVEFSDLVFALDSIPAIFSITTDPLIVFTSNIFAILGLRALYFLVSGLVQMFAYLKPGVALILAFVGVKMLIVHWVHISTGVSLGVVVGILAASITLSVVRAPKH